MTEAKIRNQLRARAVVMSRAFKDLFWGAAAPRRAIWRRLFLADGGADTRLRRSGQQALADLREFCFAQKSTFDPNPQVMARREGRREVFVRITKYLNLDEETVQQLMEIDDGIG